MLDFMRKLYEEQLLDPEFLTCTQASWTSKMTQKDKAFVTFDWIARMDMFRQQAAETVPEYDLRFAYPVGPTGQAIKLNQIGGGGVISNGPNKILALKLFDYMLSPSGAELITLGIEGETFELDDNGKAKYLGFPEDKKIEITDLEEKYGMFIEGLYKRMDRRSIYFQFSEREQEAQDKIVNENRIAPMNPIVSFNAAEKEVIVENLDRLNKAAEEFSVNYVLTGRDTWNEWLKTAEQYGVRKVEDAYNAAQARLDSVQ